jgi:hypothetical protein
MSSFAVLVNSAVNPSTKTAARTVETGKFVDLLAARPKRPSARIRATSSRGKILRGSSGFPPL